MAFFKPTPAEVTKYSDDFKNFYGIDSSVLQPLIGRVVVSGEAYTARNIKKVAKSTITKGRATGSATVYAEVSPVCRTLNPTSNTWATLVSKLDIARVVADPRSSIAKEAKRILAEQKDADIATAITGPVMELNSAGVPTSTVFPAGQKVATAAGGIKLADLIAWKLKLDTDRVPKSGRNVALRAVALSGLLSSTEVTSSDYNAVKTLVNGEIDTFMGFKFTQCEDVPAGKAIVFHTDACVYGESVPMYTRMKEIEERNYDWSLFWEEMYGALRIDDTGVLLVTVTP